MGTLPKAFERTEIQIPQTDNQPQIAMPRRRSQVKESSAELQEIEFRVAGTRYEPAIRMLRLLEEDPERTLSEVAVMIDRSDRTVRRWWRLYLDEGVEALLETAPAGGRRPSKLDAAAHRAFQIRARQNGFSAAKDAQKWLVEEYGVEYSISRVSELLKTARASSNGADTQAEPPTAEQLEGIERVDLSHLDLVTVLNSIPTSNDPVDWITRFSQFMMHLAPDIDRISINLDAHARLSPEADQHWDTRLIQYRGDEEVEGSIEHVAYDPSDPSNPPYRQCLKDFKDKGYPVHLYHPPLAFDYKSEFGGYVGSLIIWRFRDADPISKATISLIEELGPFIASAFSTAVSRYQRINPVEGAFYDALAMIRYENNLTVQESRIITLRLLGYSYQEVADLVSVTISTVKKHLTSVHKKARTRSHAKLFARYFGTRKWI